MASTTKNVSVRFEITGNGVTVTKELNGSVSKLNLTMEQANSVAKKYKTTLDNLSGKTFKTTNAEFQKMAGNMGAMGQASGGATSAVLELGRVVQDAPYGLRGMANNITQLASQMAFATKSAGGFGAALKQMWKAMAGPLGVVFAISLVVSALEMFNNSSSKATKGVDKLNDSIGQGSAKLMALKQAMDSSNLSVKERNELIEAANEEFEDLNLKLDENNELTKDSTDRLNEKTTALINLSKAQALASLLEEKYSELLPLQSKQIELDTKAKIANARAIEQISKSTKALGVSTASGARANQASNLRQITKIEKEIQGLLDLAGDEGILDLMFKGKKPKVGGARRTRAFRQQLLNLQKEFRGYIDENEKLTERSARNRLVIEQEADAKELEIKYSLYKAKQIQRHNDYLATVKDLKLREDAQMKHNEAMELAEHNYNATAKKLKVRNQTQLAEFDRIEEERQIQANFKLRENEIKHLNQLYEDRDLLFQDRQIQLEEERLAELERLANVDGLGDKEKFDAELAVSMQRMELRQAELDHETMIIEERKRVNMEYVGFISQLGGIFQQLAGENEALATAALVVEKGAAIANVVIDAQASIAQKTASANAIPAFLGVGIPNPAYILAQVDAAKANTMTKVSAGLSIASILATSIKGGNKSVKGGSNSPSNSQGGREFDFNLVGSTGENQLAQGIAGQFNQPIQAYVVSTQMSSQQQLDARIQSTAALGE